MSALLEVRGLKKHYGLKSGLFEKNARYVHALDGIDLVFIEVKQRRQGTTPETFIGSKKINRLHSAAKDYLLSTGQADREYRFDVVSIEGRTVRHHRQAFLDRYDPSDDSEVTYESD